MATIDQLSAIDTLSDSDHLVVSVNGDSKKVTVANLRTAMDDGNPANDGKITQRDAPSASPFTTTITQSSTSVWLILTPTGTLAVGTIALPGVGYATDGQEVLVNTTQAVTALTVSASGLTVTGAPTTLAANAAFRMRYDAVNTTWYRVSS
jgi:hypothetical protein